MCVCVCVLHNVGGEWYCCVKDLFKIRKKG